MAYKVRVREGGESTKNKVNEGEKKKTREGEGKAGTARSCWVVGKQASREGGKG